MKVDVASLRPHLVDVPLIEDSGQEVTPFSYLGEWTLYYFGFTHCVSVCPQALARTTRALSALGQHECPRLLFVTVDPARDDAPTMREYLAQHFPGVTGVTGRQDSLETLMRAMRVHARRRDDENDADGYVMPHSSFTYLFDREGNYATHFGNAMTAEEMSSLLGEILRGTSPASTMQAGYGEARMGCCAADPDEGEAGRTPHHAYPAHWR